MQLGGVHEVEFGIGGEGGVAVAGQDGLESGDQGFHEWRCLEVSGELAQGFAGLARLVLQDDARNPFEELGEGTLADTDGAAIGQTDLERLLPGVLGGGMAGRALKAFQCFSRLTNTAFKAARVASRKMRLQPFLGVAAMGHQRNWSCRPRLGLQAMRRRSIAPLSFIHWCLVKYLSRHGNSLARVFDRPILDLLKIEPDSPLEVSTEGQRITIAVAPKGSAPRRTPRAATRKSRR